MIEQYEKQIFKSTWMDIKDHAKRDAIILVDGSILLSEAARAIVENDVAAVNLWIEEKLIGKPTQVQLDHWNANHNSVFLFFIAQPYVLVQAVNEQ